jgi:hypothetical protein
MSGEAFQPQLPTVALSLAVANTSAALQLNGGNPVSTNCCQVDNQTTGWAFVRFDGAADSATAPTAGTGAVTGQPGFYVAPGTSRVVRVNPNAVNAAAISSATGTVSFTPGEGRI